MAVLFPKYSTNLVIGPSNSGKSFLIKYLLSNPTNYFEKTPENIYIIHCNSQTPEYNLSVDFSRVHQFNIEDFDLNLVEPESILVFEDVNILYESIRVACNVATHHLPLLSLFIVSQNVIGNKHFELVKLCHRAIFCLKSRAASNSADYIKRTFFKDFETKDYLSKVLQFAERSQTYLLLEINSIAARPGQFIAYSNFDQVNFALAFSLNPITNLPIYIIKKKDLMDVESLVGEITSPPPPNTFVILPFNSVFEQVKKKSNEVGPCASEKNWSQVLATVYSIIEQDLPLKRWRNAKSLARYVLESNSFCVTIDGRFISLKNRPLERVVFFDFLNDATRRATTWEKPKKEWKLFKMFVKALVDSGNSTTPIKNSHFLKR